LPLTLYDLRDIEDDDRECYIEGILYEGQIVLLIGTQKVGKSYLSAQWSVALAAGADWGQGRLTIPKPRNVLYYQTEGTKFDLAERTNPIFEFYPAAGERWTGDVPEELDLSADVGIPTLIKMLKEEKIDVLFIDSLFSSMQGDINRSQDVSKVKATLNKIQGQCPNVAFVILHHEHRPIRDPKAGGFVNEGAARYAGSYVLAAMADQFWLYTEEKNDEGERRRFETAYTRSRSQDIDPFYVTIDENGLLHPDKVSMSDNIFQVRQYLKSNGKTSKSQYDSFCKGKGIADRSRYRYIKTLRDSKEIYTNRDKGVIWYVWSDK
jgi:RecA-family ATPase